MITSFSFGWTIFFVDPQGYAYPWLGIAELRKLCFNQCKPTFYLRTRNKSLKIDDKPERINMARGNRVHLCVHVCVWVRDCDSPFLLKRYVFSAKSRFPWGGWSFLMTGIHLLASLRPHAAVCGAAPSSPQKMGGSLRRAHLLSPSRCRVGV